MLARYACPMARRDGRADERDQAADERDDAADRSDRKHDALDRRGEKRDERDLVALFDEATSGRDQTAVDQTLSKVDRQAPVMLASASDYAAMQPERRYAALLIAMDDIRAARYGLDRANGQGGSAFEVRRREHELLRAREAYMRLVST
jgi:hypothetical protein